MAIMGAHLFERALSIPPPIILFTASARDHKEMIRSYLRGLAAEVEGTDPVTLSEQLYLLFEGAITASQLHGEPWPAEYARQAAQKLLAAPSIELHPPAKRNQT